MSEEQPVVVNPNVTPAQVRTFLRYAITFAAAIAPSLLEKYVPQARQTLLLSDIFVEAVSYTIAGAMTAWGMAESWINKRKLVAAAHAAPDTKFIVSAPGDVK